VTDGDGGTASGGDPKMRSAEPGRPVEADRSPGPCWAARSRDREVRSLAGRAAGPKREPPLLPPPRAREACPAASTAWAPRLLIAIMGRLPWGISRLAWALAWSRAERSADDAMGVCSRTQRKVFSKLGRGVGVE